MEAKVLIFRKQDSQHTINLMQGIKTLKERSFTGYVTVDLVKEWLNVPLLKPIKSHRNPDKNDKIRIPYRQHNSSNMQVLSDKDRIESALLNCIFCEQSFELFSEENCRTHPICRYCLKHLFVSYITSSFLPSTCPFNNCVNKVNFSIGHTELNSKFNVKTKQISVQAEKYGNYYESLKIGKIMQNDLGNIFVVGCVKCDAPSLNGQTNKSGVICTNCQVRFCKYCYRKKEETCCKEKNFEFQVKNEYCENIALSLIGALVVLVMIGLFWANYRVWLKRKRWEKIVLFVMIVPYTMVVLVLLLPYASLLHFILRR